MSSKKVAILVESQYEDSEKLLEAGYETFTVGSEQGKAYNSKHGQTCKADVGIDEIDIEALSAIVIPGGNCPEYLRQDKRFVELVRIMVTNNKVVAAICHGPLMLCAANCIDGRHLTCYCDVKDDIKKCGGLYEDSPVVVDGNLVTSRIPSDLPEFCKAIITLLR